VPIKEGENEGSLQISANGNAQIAKWKICVVGSVDYGKGPVFISTQLIDLEVAAPFIAGHSPGHLSIRAIKAASR
jgi:hypothetical protein